MSGHEAATVGDTVGDTASTVTTAKASRQAGVRRAAPLLLAGAFLLIGYLRLAPGTAHPGDYHDYAFREVRYSDVIALYLRDHLERHPQPYLDYALEYPALLGGLSYLLSFAPTLPAYFALTYALLALGALGTVAALGRLPGADAWYFAAAPTLVAYAGLNWDLAAVGCTAAALLAYARGRDRLGTLALVAAVWLKLFPLPILAAVLVARLLQRRFRAAAEIGLVFAVGSAVVNLPLALRDQAGWAYFFAFNSERGAGSGLWLWLPWLTTAQVNRLTIAALALGGAAMALVAWRGRGAVLLPLGAGLLLWWLLLNKVYSPQYALWVYEDALIGWELHYLRAPLEVLRVALLAACVGYALWQLARGEPGTTDPPRPGAHPASAAGR